MVDLPASVVAVLSTMEIVLILFFKAVVLKQPLPPSSFVGVGLVFLASILIGMAPLLDRGMVGTVSELGSAIGIVLTVSGAVINAIFFAYLEVLLHRTKIEANGIKAKEEEDIKMSPLFLAGGIGIFSTIVNVSLLVSIDACVLGLDGYTNAQACAADWQDAFEMISNSGTLAGLVVSFVALSTAWNILCPYLIEALDAVYGSMMFGFRAVLTWILGIAIFYCAGSDETAYGESWTRFSPLILVGLVVLTFGALIYSQALQGTAFAKACFGDNAPCVNVHGDKERCDNRGCCSKDSDQESKA